MISSGVLCVVVVAVAEVLCSGSDAWFSHIRLSKLHVASLHSSYLLCAVRMHAIVVCLSCSHDWTAFVQSMANPCVCHGQA